MPTRSGMLTRRTDLYIPWKTPRYATGERTQTWNNVKIFHNTRGIHKINGPQTPWDPVDILRRDIVEILRHHGNISTGHQGNLSAGHLGNKSTIHHSAYSRLHNVPCIIIFLWEPCEFYTGLDGSRDVIQNSARRSKDNCQLAPTVPDTPSS